MGGRAALHRDSTCDKAGLGFRGLPKECSESAIANDYKVAEVARNLRAVDRPADCTALHAAGGH